MNILCPICKNYNVKFIYHFSDSPAVQNKLYFSRKDALKEKKMVIDLYGCKNCGFVFNKNYNHKESDFSSLYDARLDFSPYLHSYLLKLAKELITKYQLHAKKVAEIGSGKGDFLEILYAMGVKNIKGFDSTYINHNPVIDKLIKKEHFNKRNATGVYDFIICRHVLPYITNLRSFISLILSHLKRGGAMYFEFQDLNWIIRQESLFDFHYEYYGYLTKSSIIYLFVKEGFFDITFQQAIGGQYLKVEVTSKNLKIGPPRVTASNFIKINKFIKRKINYYRQLTNSIKEPFIIWGAGAKGVTFLNRLKINFKKCPYIIDINPNKQNKFIPITGQQIVSPSILADVNIKVIIIVNPVYKKEIKKMARKYNYKGKFILI